MEYINGSYSHIARLDEHPPLYPQVEIKVYKQKVKHLLYEHQNNITTLKADGELALKLQQVRCRTGMAAGAR